jgi:acetolactate synthase-1/2/3 large subunit
MSQQAASVRQARSRVADALVEALADSGVDTYFGVPGGSVSHLFDAVLGSGRTRLVESRHETGAVFAAMGYALATGRVPCVLVTAGPGATNAVTGVAAAHCERVPVLVVSGDVAWAERGERLLQDSGPSGLDIEQIFRSITGAQLRVPSAAAAVAHALSALRVATRRERPGPVLLVVSSELGAAPAPPARLVVEADRRADEPDRALVRSVGERLLDAERPLLVLGAGVRERLTSVTKLVNALDVPFVTTPRAKGVVTERHPRSLRNGGLAASRWARDYTARGVDAALVLGTDLDDCSTGATPYVAPHGELVHVDLDARVFGRNLPTSLGVVADLGAFADALSADRGATRAKNERAARELQPLRRESPVDVANFAGDRSSPLAPFRALADLEAAAGSAARFVSDIGEHMLFALHYLTADDPKKFVVHLGLGSVGSGIGSAIGLALGDPSRRVICVCGDGGMQMSGMEALVARKERLNVVFAVFNDARYNLVFHGFREMFGREAPWGAPPVDFVTWAASLGIPGARIERPGQVSARLLDELGADGPCVLDVRIDREVSMSNPGRDEALPTSVTSPTSKIV